MSGRSLFKGCAQVDTASLADMHGEAEKTEKQKARGSCVGAGGAVRMLAPPPAAP